MNVTNGNIYEWEEEKKKKNQVGICKNRNLLMKVLRFLVIFLIRSIHASKWNLERIYFKLEVTLKQQ